MIGECLKAGSELECEIEEGRIVDGYIVVSSQETQMGID